MMKLMRKVLACTLVLMLVLGSVSCAMAGTFYSNAFKLPSVQARPTESAEPEETEAPADTGEPVETEAPAETETPVETEAPAETEEPVETEAPAETEEPAETEAPAETETPTIEEDLHYTFMRDGEGNLMLDSLGNPVVIVPDGLEIPAAYIRDESGTLILDENGDPIVCSPVDETITPEENADANEGGEIAVRVSPSGMSEIIATIAAGEPVTAISIYGDWVQVIVDGVEGYVYLDDIKERVDIDALPETETEDPTANFKVTIFSSRRSVMIPGELVYLTSKVEGFDDYEISYQWQCDKGNGFEDVPGANADSYSFPASVETLGYDWRLAIYYQ